MNNDDDDSKSNLIPRLDDILKHIENQKQYSGLNLNEPMNCVKSALNILINMLIDDMITCNDDSAIRCIEKQIIKKIRLFPTEKLTSKIDFLRIIQNMKSSDDVANIRKALFIPLHHCYYRPKSDGFLWRDISPIFQILRECFDKLRHMESNIQ